MYKLINGWSECPEYFPYTCTGYIELHCWGYPCKLSLTIQFSFTVNHFYYTRNLPGIYTSWCKTCILSNEILPNKNLYIKLQLLIRNLGEIL